jgi:filamentous hemagglutinin
LSPPGGRPAVPYAGAGRAFREGAPVRWAGGRVLDMVRKPLTGAAQLRAAAQRLRSGSAASGSGGRGVESGVGAAVASKGGLKSGVPGDDFVPNPTAGAYKRPSGAGPTAAQKRSVQDHPCVHYGPVTPEQVADHVDPLVVAHYRTGTIDKVRQTAIDAVQPHCPTCSTTQGGQLRTFGRRMRHLLGFD